MPKRKSSGKQGSQKPKKQKGGSGIERILVPLITVFLAVPLLAAAVASQSPFTLPDFKLEWPGASAPSSKAQPTARPPAATRAPAAAPPRQESVPTNSPTKAATAAATATARPAPTAAATTAPSLTPGKMMLKVPVYRQQHALSCEAASLRMALATFGVQLSEDNLLAKLTLDPTPRKVVGDMVQWGDPDVGFVGKWDGVYLKDGYGVYEEPIADLGMSYGFQTTRHGKNVDPKQLYSSVRDGFPSVVWMPYDLTVKGRGAWTTPAGKRVPYVVTEHAVVLAGIDAAGVYYADPMKPDLQYAAFPAFEKAIAELDGRYVTLKP